jgi:hypothetical protein
MPAEPYPPFPSEPAGVQADPASSILPGDPSPVQSDPDEEANSPAYCRSR